MTEPLGETRLWPVSPFDLADAHRCPSCFAAISAATCPVCGFALTDPRAAGVLELGRQIVSVELARQQLMDEIRLASASSGSLTGVPAETTDAAVPQLVAAGTVVDPAVSPSAVASSAALDPAVIAEVASPAGDPTTALPADPETDAAWWNSPTAAAPSGPLDTAAPVAGTAPVAPEPVPSWTPGGAEPAAPQGVTASAPRRRLTVPVLLLIVGVSLVGVAAVFFLLLAWFVAGIEMRALIIGGITLATVVLASWLRRRDLGATAEAIGVLGVGLLALDAWAVRANDLWGAGSTDAAVYAGAAALVVAVVCRLWARISGLRGPDLAASLALPAGVAFLVGGLVDLPVGEAVTAGFLGAAVGGLAHALPAPWSAARSGAAGTPERLILALAGIGSLVGAAVTAALATGDAAPVIVWSSALVAVLGAAHAWAAHPRTGIEPLPGAVVIAGAASSVAAAVAGIAGWQLALRLEEPLYTLLIGPVLPVIIAVALDVARARRASVRLLPPALTAAVIAGASIAGALVAWLFQARSAVASGWTLWQTNAFTLPVSAPEAPAMSAAAAVVIAGLLFAAPTLRRPVLSDLRAVVVAVLLLAAAARTAIPAVVVGTALLVAVASLVGAARASARTGGADRVVGVARRRSRPGRLAAARGASGRIPAAAHGAGPRHRGDGAR
ncbi:hypothetical protein ACI3KY_12215 [Microbacterium sp. ZW T2_14]|uniref:hypothetical protein n=1 Tax=Microbacterium sp. ZW T2_14 TaxID=3378079 RepID=UPI003854225C